MKKRILAIILSSVMLLTLLTGCGKSSYPIELPTEAASSDIYVEKIDGLSEDFIRGMDVSIVAAEEASGVKYYTADGEEQDVFQLLADAGINYARIRVWNDPYDADGNGYGGGNCTAETAAELGARAAAYGMQTCVDFHYSDFWADPNKQQCPKEWEGYTIDEKIAAIYDYTVESLNLIIDEGADVGMVQIGNEINHGMAGESDWDNELALLCSAADAVRAVAEEKGVEIKIVCHFTEIDDPEHILEIAGDLERAGVDYDVFGVSFYTYWHGTLENMSQLLSDITSTYGKETCVMETAYMYYGDDTDGSGNSCSSADMVEGYPISVQGQANNLRDVMAAANAGGSLGVFYWGGCWIAVGTNPTTNAELWEEYGSGWASKYAGSYDTVDAAKNYGGSGWDNQALFNSSGKALSSLNVFKYVYCGCVGGELEVLAVPDLEINLTLGEELILPDTVPAVYNDTSVKDELAVTWDEEDLSLVDTNTAKTYTVHGEAEDGTKLVATIKVSAENLLLNSSFEEPDSEVWIFEANAGYDNCFDYQMKAADAYDGDYSLHFWDNSDICMTAYQTVTDLPGGTYAASAYMQGGDIKNDNIVLSVAVLDADGNLVQTYDSDPVKLDGWVNWKQALIEGIEVPDGGSVTVSIIVECGANGWGTIDCVELYAMQ